MPLFARHRSKPSVRTEDDRFIQSVQSIEQTLKRSLTGAEYRVMFSCDENQAELITNLVKEARNEP